MVPQLGNGGQELERTKEGTEDVNRIEKSGSHMGNNVAKRQMQMHQIMKQNCLHGESIANVLEKKAQLYEERNAMKAMVMAPCEAEEDRWERAEYFRLLRRKHFRNAQAKCTMETEGSMPASASNTFRQSLVSRESVPVISPRNESRRSNDISSGSIQTSKASTLDNQQIPETEQPVPVEPVPIARHVSQHRIDEIPQVFDPIEILHKGDGFSPRPYHLLHSVQEKHFSRRLSFNDTFVVFELIPTVSYEVWESLPLCLEVVLR